MAALAACVDLRIGVGVRQRVGVGIGFWIDTRDRRHGIVGRGRFKLRVGSGRLRIDRYTAGLPQGMPPGLTPRATQPTALADSDSVRPPRCGRTLMAPLCVKKQPGVGVLGCCLAGPGSGLSEEPAWGCEPVALE